MALKLETCALQQIKLAVCENTDVAKNSFVLAWYFSKLLYVKQLYNHTCSKTFACKNTCSKTLVRKTLVANRLYEKRLWQNSCSKTKSVPSGTLFVFMGETKCTQNCRFFKIDCFHVPKKHKRMQKLRTCHNFCLSSRRKRLPLGKSAVATKKAKLP